MQYQKFCSLAAVLIALNISSFWHQPAESGVIEEKEQYTQYLELGANHGLRVLASSTSTDFEVIEHHGVNEYLTHLQHAATELVDSIVSKSQSDFTVFDYGMYPLLVFQDEADGSEQAFQAMIDQAENVYNAQYYLLIGKQLNPSNNSVDFRVALKLPQTGAFEGMNQSFLESFQETVLTTIIETYASTASIALPEAEEAGVEALQSLVNNISGLLGGEMNEELLGLLGFTEMPCDLTGLNKDGSENHTATVKNYAGIIVDNVSANTELQATLNASEITTLGARLQPY